MNRPYLLSACLICISLCLSAQPDTLRLKGKREIGALAFDGSSPMVDFKSMSTLNPWKKTLRPIIEVPDGWGNYFREDIWFQAGQFAFQNYKEGRVTKGRLEGLMKSWKFDTVNLSSQNIQCFVTMLFRREPDGSIEYVLDRDGDMQFADEKIYNPVPDELYDSLETRDSIIRSAPFVYYEVCTSQGVIKDSVPLVVGHSSIKDYGDYLVYYHPEYYQVNYNTDTIIVRGDRPDYSSIELCFKNSINTEHFGVAGEKYKAQDLIELNEKWYKIEGFDRGNEELILTAVNIREDIVHPQKGFYAPEFTLRNYNTSEAMVLEQFKGKYLILDFWGTWCTGCVQALPEFVELHKKMKEKPVEILSVACFSDETNFNKLREKYGMDWLHAWQSAPNGIIKDYQVSGYPVYFLIGPDGKILNRTLFLSEIEKNLMAQLEK